MMSVWETFKGVRALLRFLILVPVVSGLVIGGSRAGLFRDQEWTLTDQFFWLRPPELDHNILDKFVIVTIDESDLKSVQQWPMTDAVMLQLFKHILAQNPRLVGMDIYRDLPVEPGNKTLQALFAQTPNIIGIEKVVNPAVAPPPILAEKGQVAASDLFIDRDGKIRRGAVILGKPDGQLVEGLGTALALRYLEAEGIELEIVDADRQIYQLGQAEFVPLRGNEHLYTSEETGGYQILLNYHGNLDEFPHKISLNDVLQNRIEPGLMTDRIVLIGSKAPSLNDNHRTPYNSHLFSETKLMPGVVIHANMTAQILSGSLNDRPFLRPTTIAFEQVLIIICTIYSTVSGILYVKYRWIAWSSLTGGIGILMVLGYLLFLHGWMIPLFTPLLALFLGGLMSMGTSLWMHLQQSYQTLAAQHQLLEASNQQLKLINEKYSRFVPFEYLKFLDRESIFDLKLGDHVSREMAIMFSDIRDFTGISESMNPQEIFDFVNIYLQKVSPEIRNHGGIVVKFMGDSIMSIFPTEIDRCIDAAIAKQHRLAEYNKERAIEGLKPIRIGIGIHVGNVMLGIIGEESRMQGDVLSDAVNLAARLESLTKYYGVSIIISGDTLLHLEHPDRYNTRLLDQVIVKGKTESIALFEVLDAEPKKIFQLKKVSQMMFEQGLFYYFNKDFAKAHDHFKHVLSINPDDRTSQLYLDRIAYFDTHDVPSNWRGVWHFNEK